MAMGLISDEQLEKELKRNGNRGRSIGDVNVPSSLRKVIGQDAIENGRQSALALAKSFGISDSSVSAYANGANSTANYKEGSKGQKEHVDQVRHKITKIARSRLLASLRNITPEKLEKAKLKDVSMIAKDMSAIIKNMEPSKEQSENEGKPLVNIVLFAPQRKKESEYEVIQVSE